MIVISTSYTRTPSVAATVLNLRTVGYGATYGPTSPASLASFRGIKFDGKIVSNPRVHPVHAETEHRQALRDATHFEKGEVFRIVVLNVRHKTVVIYTTTATLPPADFHTFLAKAEVILKSLRFPG